MVLENFPVLLVRKMSLNRKKNTTTPVSSRRFEIYEIHDVVQIKSIDFLNVDVASIDVSPAFFFLDFLFLYSRSRRFSRYSRCVRVRFALYSFAKRSRDSD